MPSVKGSQEYTLAIRGRLRLHLQSAWQADMPTYGKVVAFGCSVDPNPV